MDATTTTRRYIRPSRSDRLFNAVLRGLLRLGVSAWGARELRVVGRRSGKVRRTVVNLLTVDGATYLVAPRGVTEWVRNLRAAGEGELRVGRRIARFDATEVADPAKIPVLRAYLERWAFEVGRFFDGVTAASADADLAAVAAGFPAFAIRMTEPPR